MFYPKRARERAIYLYSEILQTRGGLLSYLKKQAKLRLLKHENIEKVWKRNVLVLLDVA